MRISPGDGDVVPAQPLHRFHHADRLPLALENRLRETNTFRRLEALVAVMPGKQAVDIVADIFGGSRKAWYQRMLDLKADKS